MFFAKFNINGRETAELYYNWDKYHADTFNPDTRFITLIKFTISGKDYQSRKASLENTAIEWSNADIEGIYTSDLIEIQEWFYRNGIRYGLLREFKENAIC